MEFSVDVSVTETGRGAPAYNLDSDLNGEVTLAEFLEFTKASLIIIASETLKEEQANGFDPKPIVAVDGQKNKPVIAVSPLGSIEFTSKASMDAILQDTYEAIRFRSPVDTGKYIKSHYVFLNGIQVASDFSSFEAWLATRPEFKEKDLIRFVNIQPYARKLERYGITAQRQQSRTVKSSDKRGRSGVNGRILAPNGTYFLTTRAIRRKYKRNSIISFSFLSGSSLGLSATFKTQTGGARGGGSFRRKKSGRTYLYPTITISVQESGIA